MPYRGVEVPEVRAVHTTPLGEVRTVPPDPTATNCVPDQVMPDRVPSEDVTVQLFPWGTMITAVAVVVPVTLPAVAVMVVGPSPIPMANPCEPAALLMVALVTSEELQVTAAVTSWVVPFE
jgi:hypothetical protein